jgi:hypothetical protein
MIVCNHCQGHWVDREMDGTIRCLTRGCHNISTPDRPGRWGFTDDGVRISVDPDAMREMKRQPWPRELKRKATGRPIENKIKGQGGEKVDAGDLKSLAPCGHTGSIPVPGISKSVIRKPRKTALGSAPHRTYNRISREDQARIVELALTGMSLRAIARETGLAVMTVSKYSVDVRKKNVKSGRWSNKGRSGEILKRWGERQKP